MLQIEYLFNSHFICYQIGKIENNDFANPVTYGLYHLFAGYAKEIMILFPNFIADFLESDIHCVTHFRLEKLQQQNEIIHLMGT